MVAAYYSGQIGEVTLTSHAIHVYDTRDGLPTSLAISRDGHLWYTEPFLGQIGEMDMKTHDILGTFGLPGGMSNWSNMILGPDGDLWFTQGSVGLIGELDPSSGAISGYAVPAGSGRPEAIAWGPGGTLWTADGYARRIWRVGREPFRIAVRTGAATEVAQTEATLHGAVRPVLGSRTTWSFQYGPTRSLGHNLPLPHDASSALDPGQTPVAVVVRPSELLPGRTYYYRLTAANPDGTGHGAVRTFRTAAP